MKTKKTAKKITKSTKFNEIFEDENAMKILQEKGMHCMGCPFASMESLDQGARAHGLDADEIVREINKKRKKESK